MKYDLSTCYPTLVQFLKKVGFQWEKSQERAFQALKERLTNAPILALPNFNKSFDLECDASNVGSLTSLTALFFPKECLIHSDHEAIKHLRGKNKLNKRHAKKSQCGGRCPSRRHSLLVMLEIKLLDFEHKRIYTLKMGISNRPMNFVLLQPMDNSIMMAFSLRKKYCVPKISIRELLVNETHEDGLMAHFGEYKTSKILQEHLF
ncbi:hypothetical protein CR513_18750, partial [Mucuna pruriens]